MTGLDLGVTFELISIEFQAFGKAPTVGGDPNLGRGSPKGQDRDPQTKVRMGMSRRRGKTAADSSILDRAVQLITLEIQAFRLAVTCTTRNFITPIDFPRMPILATPTFRFAETNPLLIDAFRLLARRLAKGFLDSLELLESLATR